MQMHVFSVVRNMLVKFILWTHSLVRRMLLISKKNSVALVRERTIATERPPPVGKVSANFCG